MKKLIRNLLTAARRYGILDFAVFKLALLLIGIVLGMYLHEFFFGLRWLVWILAAVSVAYMLARTVRCFPDRDK